MDEVQRHAAAAPGAARRGAAAARRSARWARSSPTSAAAASRPRPLSAAASATTAAPAASRWRQARLSAPPPAPPRSRRSATHGAPRAARSVRSMLASVQRLRCVPRTAGSSTIRAAGRVQAHPELDVLDRRARVAPRVEAADGVEGLAADRAEAGPERRRLAGAADVDVVVQEVAKARHGWRRRRAGRRRRRRRRPAPASRVERSRSRRSASGWTSTSASTKTRISPSQRRAPALRAAAGPLPGGSVTTSTAWGSSERASAARQRSSVGGASVAGMTTESNVGKVRVPGWAREDSRPLAVLGAGPAGLTAGYVLARSAHRSSSSRPTRRSAAWPARSCATATASTSAAIASSRNPARSSGSGRRSCGEELLVRDAPVADLLARALHRLPAAPRRRRAQGRTGRARALRGLLRARARAPPGPPARGRDVRGVGLRPLRAAPVRAVLQELHREGLGRADDGDPRRVGRPADPHAVVLARRARRAAQRRRRRAQPHRAVSLPAARARADVGGDGGGDRRRGRRGPARRAGDPPGAARRARGRGPRRRRARRGGATSSRRWRCATSSRSPIRRRPRRCAAPPPGLRYRDFLTVALVVEGEDLFPDNWIYIHDPHVRVGRIQNFRAWSEAMVPDAGRTCVGMEYFCFEGDALWNAGDDELVARATRELEAIGLAPAPARRDRPRRAGAEGLSDLRRRLRGARRHDPRLAGAGSPTSSRSAATGCTATTTPTTRCSPLCAPSRTRREGAAHDLWAVNADGEYHEEARPRVAALPRRPRDARACGPADELAVSGQATE